MSVVACRVTKEKIEVSADSISVRGYTQEKITDKKYAKLCEVNGMIIGGVGLASENGMLQMFAASRKPATPTIDSLLEFMVEFGEWKKKKIDKYSHENDFIIVTDNHAFYAASDLCIKEISDYQAIGAGMDYALAALYLGCDTKKAVEVASELSIYCEKPIITFEVKKL